jgi:signal transduction histidine kinase
VIDNLLDNALKFTPEGGRIKVRAWQPPDDHTIHVAVSDTGIGIEPANRQRIFERFYQVDGSATRIYGGTGLGLALCKEVVEAHGGQIWIESEPGAGSTFTFTVPTA